MRIRDLGDMQGEVLVFGGPYSNLQALEALLDTARSRGIPPERIICTGDVVAYGADPVACVSLIRQAGLAVVAGNVERQLAAGAADCGCGFEEGTTCDRLSGAWYAYADARVGPEDRDWMAALPDMITFRLGRRHVAMIHGGASDIARFLWPCDPDGAFAPELAIIRRTAPETNVVISGHCGFAFARHIKRALWLNAGVIGLPPNGGAPETRYATLSGTTQAIHRLRYDHPAARAAMEAAGLTQGYHETLTTGLWPSEDVLPAELRRGAPVSSC